MAGKCKCHGFRWSCHMSPAAPSLLPLWLSLFLWHVSSFVCLHFVIVSIAHRNHCHFHTQKSFGTCDTLFWLKLLWFLASPWLHPDILSNRGNICTCICSQYYTLAKYLFKFSVRPRSIYICASLSLSLFPLLSSLYPLSLLFFLLCSQPVLNQRPLASAIWLLTAFS